LKLIEDKGYFACEFCGSLVFPKESADGVRDLGVPTSVNCPLCGIPLVLAWAGGAQLLHCTRCRGMLIHQTAFAATVRYLRSTASDPPIAPPPMNREDLQRRIACPHCGQVMDTHAYGGPGNIVIDNCPRCHVNWLDYNEFGRIVNAPGRDRRQPR